MKILKMELKTRIRRKDDKWKRKNNTHEGAWRSYQTSWEATTPEPNETHSIVSQKHWNWKQITTTMSLLTKKIERNTWIASVASCHVLTLFFVIELHCDSQNWEKRATSECWYCFPQKKWLEDRNNQSEQQLKRRIKVDESCKQDQLDPCQIN
jgi:hypothetical protein